MIANMKTSAMQKVMRIATLLLLLAYTPTLWAQHNHSKGSIALDEVFLDLRQPGKLADEFPKEKTDMVRVLHLRGPLNSDDMRFVKRLADRSKVVNAKGDKVEAYLDLDMEEARLVRGGLLGGHSDSRAIWSSLFSGCRLLRSVILPRTTEEIGDHAFYGCYQLERVDMPRDVRIIGNAAFSGCRRLHHITLPRRIHTIGNNAFYDCDGLRDIYLPDELTTLGKGAFESCDRLENVSMPEQLAVIPDRAFYGTAIRTITLPYNLAEIGDYAFKGTSITELTIPATVTYFSPTAVNRCDRLRNIFVEQGNAQYADIDGVLYSADLAHLLLVPNTRQGLFSIPEGTVAIGDFAMNNCRNITMIDIPETVMSIGDYAFAKCTSLTTMTLPETLTHIGKGALSGCSSLTSATLPTTLTHIPAEMFDECDKLMSTCMPEGVVSIGERAYHKCTSLTEVTLPRSVTTIGEEAFRGCKNMTMFKMYESVTKMGDKIVYDCKHLNTFFSLCPTPPEVSKVTDEKVSLVVPADSVSLYKKAKGWKKFRTISGI
ncbi:MAG: leucine-rich repeat domain-containing protein [Prevotella sp.]|nr:leucine-rich repeat domain-containing protein [Prevotella sp.]